MTDTAELLIVVPTRSRPHNVARLARAWADTGAWDRAELMLAMDADDPTGDGYLDAVEQAAREYPGARIALDISPVWRPMVHKLDAVVVRDTQLHPARFAIGFAGDDHLPRTAGWVDRFLEELYGLSSGIVYPDDGYQGQKLPTSWAMTAGIVRALGRMVPAPVEHLFCDNAVRDLGEAAGRLRYLPDVLVEHLHPVAGKAETDEQYQSVNGRQQWRRDQRAYREWRRSTLAGQAEQIRRLIAEGDAR